MKRALTVAWGLFQGVMAGTGMGMTGLWLLHGITPYETVRELADKRIDNAQQLEVLKQQLDDLKANRCARSWRQA